MAEIGNDIAKAANLLIRGELVAIPTETVYGLAANALNPAAIKTIFEIKKRPFFDPLIVHFSNLNQAMKYIISMPSTAKKLADTFWPGPLTLVVKKKRIIPDIVTAGLDTVAIRCVNHILTSQLLAQLPFPLAAPSANPFGYTSPTLPEHVDAQLGDKIAYILDGGRCKVGIESTIIGFKKSTTTVYRTGGISNEELENTIGSLTIPEHNSSSLNMPGTLTSHYATKKPMVIGKIDMMARLYPLHDIGILRFRDSGRPCYENEIILSPSGKLEEAAYNLFFALRRLDSMNIRLILAELVPDVGLGKAINDRLKKASAKQNH